MGASTQSLGTRPSSPTMQTIIVHHLAVIDPQLTAFIRIRPEAVVPMGADFQEACPPHCKVVLFWPRRPVATSVTVVWLRNLLSVARGSQFVQVGQTPHSRCNLVESFFLQARDQWWWCLLARTWIARSTRTYDLDTNGFSSATPSVPVT